MRRSALPTAARRSRSCEQAVQAAQRSLDIATIQYREGLVDFQRVLDSQRTLFSQQERLVTSRGNVTQSLIALYKAMGGGWQAGRERPVVDEQTRETMGERSDWKELLRGAAAAAADRFRQTRPPRNGNAMTQEQRRRRRLRTPRQAPPRRARARASGPASSPR